ncbi:MFS transporter [Cohnella sp. CIP 111063]|jgi:PPP family 3-phenylpropionic acid transporter|uniref:MFS transporter n=1 Tax=unclassified Cohnella TaxID=2636738 RepID=UPI000B8C024A|nr:MULTISPECIES: MFS transporter [unclassified Cohnella]OXS57985.1 MFS transporter [Cohnella sp. CIP 111063]PRX71318.1 PPP family 3-phenylpropionic acid transporter [Cohnella sp. SGD-V74]
MNNGSVMRGQLFVLRSLQFANYAAMVLLVTYFPLYFESLGFSKLQIGAIYSVGPFLSIVSNLVVGILSDRMKNLPRILNVLYLVQILALALLLPQKEFGIMAGIMALFYLFQTPNNSMLDSVSLLAAERMKISFPSIRMFGSLGYAVCAVVFGYVLKTFGSDLTIWLILGVVLVSLVFSFFIGDYQATLRKFEFRGLWELLRRRETLVFFGLIMVISVAHRTNEGFLSIAMREIGADDSVIGYASLASAVSEIPMFFLLAKFGHRFREYPLLAIASAFYVIRLGLLSLADEPWMMVALQMTHAITFAIFYITALRGLQALIPDEYRSSGQAVFAVVWSGLAGVIAGTLGGWLYDSFGLSRVFQTGAVFALIGMIGFLIAHVRRR